MSEDNPTKNPQPSQLSLFDITEFEMPRPAPLTAMAQPGFIRCTDDRKNLLLCAVDVVMWAKDEDYETARISWRDAKTAWKRDESQLVEKLYQLKARSSDGKMYETDFIDQEQLYRLAFDLPGKKTARFKDAVAHLLSALTREASKYGQSVMDYVMSGRAASWAMHRVDAKLAQANLNSALKATHFLNAPKYGQVLSAENEALFEMSKQRIILELDLTQSQAQHYRDFLGEYAQRAIYEACDMAEKRLKYLGRDLTDEEQLAIVMRASQISARAMRDAAEFVGEDFLSGDPLDDKGHRLRQVQRKMLG